MRTAFRWLIVPAVLFLAAVGVTPPAYAGSVSDSVLEVSTSVSEVESGDGFDVSVEYTNTSGSALTSPTAVVTLPSGSRTSSWDLTTNNCTGSFANCGPNGDTMVVVFNTIANNASSTVVAHVDTVVGASETLTFTAEHYPDVTTITGTPVSGSFDVDVVTTSDASVDVAAQADLISVPHEVDYVVAVERQLGAAPVSGTLTFTAPSQLSSLAVVTGSGCSVTGLVATCTFSGLTSTQQWSFSGPAQLLATGSGSGVAVLSSLSPADAVSVNDTDSASCTFVTSVLITC